MGMNFYAFRGSKNETTQTYLENSHVNQLVASLSPKQAAHVQHKWRHHFFVQPEMTVFVL